MLGLLMTLAAGSASLPACKAEQLSLGFDSENGAFNGMSHAGTLLVLRNIGDAACQVPGLPKLSMIGANGHVLPIARAAPVGFHPGPVILPVGIAPGAELTAPLRWVSGAVFPQSRCYAPTALSLDLNGVRVRGVLAAHVCGQQGKPATFEQPPLTADPVLPPAGGA